jgi:hypothetical protein
MITTPDSGSDDPVGDGETDEPARSHALARAQRTRAVHVRDAHRDICGLCLAAWPCPPRAWADRTLNSAPPGRARP